MNYEKQTWERGETISADKLNHMEEGIANAGGGGTLVVGFDRLEGDFPNVYEVYDKTWSEVSSALENNIRVVVRPEDPRGITNVFPVVTARLFEGAYSIGFLKPISETSIGVTILYACSADGYLQSKQCDSEGGGGGDITN